MKEKLLKAFWLFILGSIVGFIVEMIYCSYRAGNLVFRPGLLYGPFIPIYGVGVLVAVIISSKVKKDYWLLIYCAILGGVVEYLFSFFQEILFNSKSWDYTKRMFNINGRTSLFHMFWWGVLGFLFIKYVYPIINKWLEKIPFNKMKVVTIIMVVFMIYNVFISSAAVIRQEERRNNIKATNVFQEYLDEKYPDELLKMIFRSKRPVR